MHFSHHPDIWSRYPELAAGAIHCEGIRRDVDAGAAIARLHAMARQRLDAVTSESELPEIQAWRRVYSRMGLKPTQYRCASESLLRRLRKEDAMPRIHPLIDVCNAISMAHGIPVAALDLAHVHGALQVRHAQGSERYLTFGGEWENPEPGEVSFVDEAGHAHARRWTNRQSGLSAVRASTSEVLVVCEAMHDGAGGDMPGLLRDLQEALAQVWGVPSRTAILSAGTPRFAA
jgi:DNA/RNA-binding domain of Phe-tRNA-synthetase-like protein